MTSDINTLARPARREGLFLRLAMLILLTGFALRLAALVEMPLYLDEAMHTWWAQNIITERQYFMGLEHAKALYPLLLALFRPSGPESPFLARMVSVLTGTLSIGATIALGRALLGRQASLLAGLIYAVLPLAVFHERQALADPLMAMLSLFSLVFGLWLARRPRAWLGLLLGVTLGAAYLAKINALPFFALPFAAAVLFGRNRRTLSALAWSAAAVLLAFAIVRGFYALAARSGFELLLNDPTEPRLRLFRLADPGVRADLARDARNFADFTWQYVGPVALALVPLSLLGLFRRGHWRALAFVWLPAVLLPLAWLLVKTESYTLPARYFVWAAGPLAVLLAMGFTFALGWLRARWRPAAPWAAGVALALLIGFGLRFDLLLISDVRLAPLAQGDRYLYITGLTAGTAYQQAARDILAAHRANAESEIKVLQYRGYHWQIGVHLGPRLGDYTWLRPDKPDQAQDIARWLASGDDVYLAETTFHGATPATHGAILEPFGRYEVHDTVLTLYRVTGAEGELARAIYENRAPPAAALATDYDALTADLLAGGAEQVLVFPASHAVALAERGVSNVIPIEPDRWPLTPAEAAAVIGDLSSGAARAPIAVVQADPDRLDPQRALSAVLLDTLYRAGEQWHGAVNLTTYVAGPRQPDYSPFDATWEDAIHLDAIALPGAASPGGALPVAVRWRTDVPVEDSFSVFAHLVDGSGQIVAQYDAVPGGGLRAMPSWQPGQPVLDRFAILLPPGMPLGTYRLRLGIYSPASGLRLRVTGDAGDAVDYVVLGTVEVAPGVSAANP